MPFRHACPVALLLAIAGAASAMEVRDLRFGLGMGPLPDRQEGTFAPNDGSTPFAAGIKYGDGTAVSGVLSATAGKLEPIGLLGGLELRFSSGDSSMSEILGTPLEGRGAPNSKYSESAAALHAGVGAALGSNDHLELLGIIGVAWVSIESPADINANVNAQKGSGNGILTGARFAWLHTWDSSWQCGLAVEYTNTDADITTHYLDGTLESSVVNAGYGARVLLGYRH